MSNTLIPDPSADVKSTLTSQWLMQRGWASVLGIGAFLGIGIAVQMAGSAAIAAFPIAAIVAIGAELNAAQLSAIPLARNPWLNFTANWALLLAKMITAAIAASGFAGYLLSLLSQPNLSWLMPIALLWVAILTVLFAIKLPPAKISQPILLAILLLLLLFFLGASWKGSLESPFLPISQSVRSASFVTCLQASALMFFAYTDSQRLPPFHPHPQSDRIKAIMTLLTMGLYFCVAWVGMSQIGSQAFGEAAGTHAPLAIALRLSGLVSSSQLVAVGAVVVLGSIVANLVLEATKMLQGMARQQDAPQIFARSVSPIATVAVGGAIVCLILTSEVETLWSFGAFAALLYAIIAHLAVLSLSASQRIYPRLLTGISFSLCLFLAFWINPKVWLVSLGLAAVGLVWRGINQWVKQQSEG
jgi:basic amino acid/polyamine antiporter, APA family